MKTRGKYVAYLENLGNGYRSLVKPEEKILVRRHGSWL